MKPAPFDYVRADSAEETVAALGEYGDEARLLAGGQSLVAMLSMRLARPKVVIDIARIGELAHVRRRGVALEVGAAATQAALARFPDLARLCPLLALAIPHIGHAQTRNRGTVCGSIAHADPTSELPLCLAALGGDVVLRSRAGRRTVPARDFQLGMLATACRAEEMVEAVRFPVARPEEGHAFREACIRRGDFALVAIAAIIGGDGIRFAVGGLSDRPEVRVWPRLSGDALDDALNDLAWELGGASDQHASARHRRDLLRRLGRQAVEEAVTCGG